MSPGNASAGSTDFEITGSTNPIAGVLVIGVTGTAVTGGVAEIIDVTVADAVNLLVGLAV